ncbi:MAG: hypothetical protein DRP42_02455 [Tenericutes bacterium]|nr:MAG: hypothetical protein DRP42_02455 [Mycoplasmatota bacterium]
MEKITGISASTGIATANAFLIKKHKLISKNIVFTSVDQEKQILDKSIKSTIEQIEQLELNLNEDIKQEAGKIFAAHKLMVNDPEMIKQTVDIITNESATAFDAYERVSKIFFDIFDSMEDEYMRERAIDVKDISTRVLSNIVGTPLQDISLIKEEVILVANDLTPSQTAQLNKKYIKGFITEIGGETSHSALISRTMGIPAMVGVGSDISKVKNGQLISIDTINSSIYIEPTQEKLGELDTLILKLQHEKEISEKYKNMKSVTLDNKEVMISANISSYKDLELVIENGADGVGLFRTEFLYMESKN